MKRNFRLYLVACFAVSLLLEGIATAAYAHTTSTLTDADYAKHVRELRKRLPARGFAVVVEKPFVVIGDDTTATVRRYSQSTVRWAVTRLKKDYFEKDPNRILDIWLFRNAASYDAGAKKFFGDKPTTPFGYYSDTDGALVMNIATGGGTLVHEIVHPFIAVNFPACPAWFNEGLGSLYEQSSERNGHIVGLTNWRLAGLQEAIRAGDVQSFESLCKSGDAFYRGDRGLHYAHARYLCYYLQEHGLLVKFYRAFRTNVAKDPTGYESLRDILGRPDIAKFQEEWEKYVLNLRFEG